MLKIGMLLAVLTIAAGAVLWMQSPAVNGSPTGQTISMQEAYVRAHLEGFPVQEFENQALIYPTVAQRDE